MDRVVAARKLVAELVQNEQLEVRRVEIVGRELAQLVETLGRPPSGEELEEWLDQHAQVTGLYAGPNQLDELVERYLMPPPSSEPEAAVEARHPELERQLRDEPDSRELYLVYADWLQEHGDPFGELIALGAAATEGTDEASARFERHLRQHEARLLGGLARQLSERAVLHWRHGVVHAIQERGAGPGAKLWEQLLRLRVCELVQSVTLRHHYVPDVDAAISACAAASLRALTLESYSGRLPVQLLRRDLRSLAVAGDRIEIGTDTFPAGIERLELRVREATAAGGSPPLIAVRELHVALTPAVVAFFAGVQLPRLERLVLAIDAATAPSLPALLESLAAPTLSHLGICNGPLAPRTFGELARLPLCARLRSLALTNVEINDHSIWELARARGAFESLTEIDVSHNELSREGLAAARAFAPSVISRRQNRPGRGMERRVREWAGSRLQVAESIAEPEAWRAARIDGELRWARYRGEDEYELYVTADLRRYGCSCPSSIQPCKHVVALALIAERTSLPEAAAGDIEDRVARGRIGRRGEI